MCFLVFGALFTVAIHPLWPIRTHQWLSWKVRSFAMWPRKSIYRLFSPTDYVLSALLSVHLNDRKCVSMQIKGRGPLSKMTFNHHSRLLSSNFRVLHDSSIYNGMTGALNKSEIANV